VYKNGIQSVHVRQEIRGSVVCTFIEIEEWVLRQYCFYYCGTPLCGNHGRSARRGAVIGWLVAHGMVGYRIDQTASVVLRDGEAFVGARRGEDWVAGGWWKI